MSEIEGLRKRIPVNAELRQALEKNGFDPEELSGPQISELMVEALTARSQPAPTSAGQTLEPSQLQAAIKSGIDKGTETLADDIINTLSDEMRSVTDEKIVKHLATIAGSLTRMDDSQREMWDILQMLASMLGILTEGTNNPYAKSIIEQLQKGQYRIDGELKKQIDLHPERQRQVLEQERLAREEMALVVEPEEEELASKTTRKGPEIER